MVTCELRAEEKGLVPENCCRTEQGLEIESWGFLIDTDPLKIESDILLIESDCLSYSGELLSLIA
jgi:hypothetical protein